MPQRYDLNPVWILERPVINVLFDQGKKNATNAFQFNVIRPSPDERLRGDQGERLI